MKEFNSDLLTTPMRQQTSLQVADAELEAGPAQDVSIEFGEVYHRHEQSILEVLSSKWKYLAVQEAFRRAPVQTIGRLISWRARCFMQRGSVVDLRPWGASMFLPAEWRGEAKLIYALREHYEPELTYLAKMLRPGTTFVDAGANIGIYSVVASKIVGETGRVISFEPSVQTFPLLRKNIALNHLKNVNAFPLALSDRWGSTKLYHGPSACLNSFARDSSWRGESEEVMTESLDQVLAETGIEQVDLIKIDVQGAEELVLQGAIRTIRSMQPLIILEVWPMGPELLGLPPFGACELLENLGYNFYYFERDGTLIGTISPPINRNVIAIHGHP